MNARHRRKPVQKPLADAIDALVWRQRIFTEIAEGHELPVQLVDPLKRMQDALADYEVSKAPVTRETPAQVGIRFGEDESGRRILLERA